MFKRTDTRAVKVRDVILGHQNKVVLQSMLNTKTKNVQASLKQIEQLAQGGCELIRFAVLDKEDAAAIKKIRQKTSVALVADIHFDYRLALAAIENGIDKVRINPGNIGSMDHVREVVAACQDRKIPIRIGINSGSLEKDLLTKYGQPCKEAMIESAQRHIDLLRKLCFEDIVISFKSSNVPLTIDTYRAAAEIYPYPLHLGVTEAGTFNVSAIKSSAALGALLHDGIGDTLRISVSGDPLEELVIAKQLLKCFGLIKNVPDLISCPTCGRIQYDMIPIVKKVEQYLLNVHSDITVAVMGCAVNGLQEAARADIGIAGGKAEGLLFKKGQIIRKVPQNAIFEELVKEIEIMTK